MHETLVGEAMDSPRPDGCRGNGRCGWRRSRVARRVHKPRAQRVHGGADTPMWPRQDVAHRLIEQRPIFVVGRCGIAQFLAYSHREAAYVVVVAQWGYIVGERQTVVAFYPRVSGAVRVFLFPPATMESPVEYAL